MSLAAVCFQSLKPRFIPLEGSLDEAVSRADSLPPAACCPPVNADTGITQRRLSNGIRVNYRWVWGHGSSLIIASRGQVVHDLQICTSAFVSAVTLYRHKGVYRLLREECGDNPPPQSACNLHHLWLQPALTGIPPMRTTCHWVAWIVYPSQPISILLVLEVVQSQTDHTCQFPPADTTCHG